MTANPVILALRTLIRAYQLILSPYLGPACRFVPSCSEYAELAISSHGALRGSMLAIYRVLRCHPFAAAGFDPVPPVPSEVAKRRPQRPAARSHSCTPGLVHVQEDPS